MPATHTPNKRPKRTAIFRQPTPEEVELFRRRSELTVRRAALAARELTLAQLRAQLNSFEGRYIRQVGVLYVQLDDWEDRIASLNSPSQISTTLDSPLPESAIPLAPTQATLDLKALFHQVAKRIHPDFARDHHDERHRTHLMAQANDAFRRDDAAILLRMLHGYDPSTDTGDATSTTAALALVLTQIDQSIQDIALINAELEALKKSEMAQLKDRTTHAAFHGRDLLAELAARVKGSIGIRRHQPAFDPSPLLTAETSHPRPTKRPQPTASRATIESDKC
jgi:hypothetical protein